MFMITQHPTCTWSHTGFGRGKRTSSTSVGFFVIEHIATGKLWVTHSKHVSVDVDLVIQQVMQGQHQNRALNKLVSMDMDLKLHEYPSHTLAQAKDLVRQLKRSVEPAYLLLNP